MDGVVPVIVATISFGMGIDKATVRSVLYLLLSNPFKVRNYSISLQVKKFSNLTGNEGVNLHFQIFTQDNLFNAYMLCY